MRPTTARTPMEVNRDIVRLETLTRAILNEVRQIHQLLAQRSGSRDDNDAALVAVIAACSHELPFTAAALWRRCAAGDVALADAVRACDLDNTKQLGKLLKRLEGHDVGGHRIVRRGANREGAIWRTVRE
jgi:hypothetical protein